MKLRAFLALALIALFLPQPAHANWQSNQVLVQGDTIQFSFMWGWAERSMQGDFTVTVDNTITNKIGGNGEVIDTFRIMFAGETIERTEKGVFVFTFSATESQVIRFEGIDRGFWGGYYGPIVTITQAVTEPVTESPSVSPEVSKSESVSPEVTESSTSEVVQPEPSSSGPALEPETETLLPTPEPTQPIAEPEPEQVVSESPQSQSSESPAATTSPQMPPTESPQSTPEQTLEPLPLPTAEPIQPSPEPIPEVTNAPTEPAEEVTQEPKETQSDSVSATVETTAFEGAREAISAVINAFATAGLDMSPEKREEAQELIVSSVIVSSVAATAVRKIK